MFEVGDRVRFVGPAREYRSAKEWEKGTVVHCNRCSGLRPASCDWCVNSIAGREQNDEPPNYCFVMWDSDGHISGVFFSNLRHQNIVEQLAEINLATGGQPWPNERCSET